MNRPAVVNSDGSRRTGYAGNSLGVQGRRVSSGQAADPVAVIIILIVKHPLVTSRYNHQRPVFETSVGQIRPDRERAVVGVGIELDVLMPHDGIVFLLPFEVQLRMVKDDVRTHEICCDVGDDVGGVVPIRLMLIIRMAQSPQSRAVGTVTGSQIENLVRLCNAAALLAEVAGRLGEPCQPVVGDEFLDTDIAVSEVRLPLAGGEGPGLMGENLLRRHLKGL